MQFKHLADLDLLSAVAAGGYAAAVAGVPALHYLGELFCSPVVAGTFAMVALGRGVKAVRKRIKAATAAASTPAA